MTTAIPLLSVLALLGVASLTGCSSAKNPPPGRTHVAIPGGGTISTGGFRAAETTVETAQESITIPVPAKSVVTIAAPVAGEPPKISVEISAPTVLTIRRDAVQVKIPPSFPPPRSPSANDLARADGLRWFYLAGIVLAIAALVLAWRGHMKAAGIGGLGAVGVPLLGNFVSSDVALWLSIAVGVAMVTLFAAWYLIQNNPELEAKIKAKVKALRR